jgi:hypothetical protein
MKKTIEVREWNSYGKKIGTVKATAYTETDNAQPTSRLLDGSRDYGYKAEYVGNGIIKMGKKTIKVKAIYLFTSEEMDGVEDEGNLPWEFALKRFETTE